ncbi:hypothetical protein NHX12_017607 [Muraenolepis orangiensis]|uniref:Uncharacterized protein n=1 Tax=Muraenolepis orangiensis TaxID=630683 RepID=A0A9Q0EY66_9TELE|nr:hypothetical protein NHX12_017607 [Muraenolepis orangiensis]
MEAAAFDLEGFVDSPSDAGLQSCRKEDLLAIAQHYGVAVRKVAGKQEVREAVLAGLVEFGVIVPLEVLAEEKQGPGDGAAPAPVEGQVEDTVVSPAWEEEGEKGATLKPTLGSLAMPPFSPRSPGAESTCSTASGTLSAARLRLRLARLQLEREASERKDSLEQKRMENESQQMIMELKCMEYEHQIKLRVLDLRKLELERPASPSAFPSASPSHASPRTLSPLGESHDVSRLGFHWDR